MGTYRPDLTDIFAEVLVEFGNYRALVVHGDGMDELTTLGLSKITEVNDGVVRTSMFDPSTLGLRPPDRQALVGGAPAENAGIRISVLQGSRAPGGGSSC